MAGIADGLPKFAQTLRQLPPLVIAQLEWPPAFSRGTIRSRGDAVNESVARIEVIIGRKVKRDIGQMTEWTKGNLARAAEAIMNTPDAHVGIVTGFYIQHAEPPSAETDGLGGMAIWPRASSLPACRTGELMGSLLQWPARNRRYGTLSCVI